MIALTENGKKIISERQEKLINNIGEIKRLLKETRQRVTESVSLAFGALDGLKVEVMYESPDIENHEILSDINKKLHTLYEQMHKLKI